MAAPFPTIANSLGSWLIASWIACFLWSIELIFCIRYFQTYKRDHWLLRAAVATSFLSGTVCVLATCAGVYRVAIKGFGDVLHAIMPTVEMSIIPLTGGLAAVIGQSYLIRRYHKVSKNWIVALILEILAVLCFGLTIWGVVCLIELAHGKFDIAYLRLAPKIVYAMVAGVDVLVSLALIIFLWQLRDSEMASTKRLLTRLCLVAFESGAITSILALATLLAFVLHSRSQIAVPFSAATGFSQSLCLLYNLNLRRVDPESITGATTIGGTYAMSKMNRTDQLGARSRLEGVTIHTETVRHLDDDDDRYTADEEKKMPVVESIPHMHVTYAA